MLPAYVIRLEVANRAEVIKYPRVVSLSLRRQRQPLVPL